MVNGNNEGKDNSTLMDEGNKFNLWTEKKKDNCCCAVKMFKVF